MGKSNEIPFKLKVTEALGKDMGRAFARMGPEDLESLEVAIGTSWRWPTSAQPCARLCPPTRICVVRTWCSSTASAGKIQGRGSVNSFRYARLTVGRQRASPSSQLPSSRAERDLDYIGRLMDGLPIMVVTGSGPHSSAVVRLTSRLTAPHQSVRADQSRHSLVDRQGKGRGITARFTFLRGYRRTQTTTPTHTRDD